MRNLDLARDYIRRARVRLRTLDVLFEADSWVDVVRESQEVVELTLKALLRSVGVDPPGVHDVSGVLRSEQDRLPEALQRSVDELAAASRELRRDRELAFHGAEDLTPTAFYDRRDAEHARGLAVRIVGLVEPHVVPAAGA